MSLDHIEIMLKTLEQYTNSEITLTFNNKQKVPRLLVCYVNNCFQLTYLNNNTVETLEIYDQIEPAITAIYKAVQSDIQEASK